MAIKYDGIQLEAEEDFSSPAMMESAPSGPIEYDGIPLEAPEPDVPFITENVSDLPTVQSLGDLPGDLMNRTLTHAKGGVESFVGGLESLAPGSEKTVWRRRQEKESPVQYLLSKLAPLGILGGPIETVASPVSALFSEGARLGGEVERQVRGLSPSDTPFLHKVEPFAPVAGSLAIAPFVPTWLGGMKRAAEASSRNANLNAAKRAAEGYQSSEGVLKGMAGRGVEEASNLGAMLRTSAAEGDRLAALIGGEARFNPQVVAREVGDIIPGATVGPVAGEMKDIGLRAKLRKMKKADPESYASIEPVLNPQGHADITEGFEVFSKAASSPYFKRGYSRTGTNYLEVPSEIADEVASLAKVPGRAGGKGKLNIDGDTLTRAYAKKFSGDDVDPDLADLVMGKVEKSIRQLHDGLKTTPWAQPIRETELASIQPSLREFFHSSRGLGVRGQRQYDTRALTTEGKNVKFNKVPAATYWPRTFTPEESLAIRTRKESERMLAGKPVTTQYDIISGEDFQNITRGGRARGGSDISTYIRDPISMLDNYSQNWGRMVGRSRAFGPKGEKWQSEIQSLVKSQGSEVAKAIDHAARRDLNFAPPRNRATDVLTSFEAMTKMSLSFVSNASQPAMNVVVNGIKDTVKGMWHTIHQAASKGSMNAITKELGIVRKAAEEALRHEMGGTIVTTKLGKLSDIVLAPFMKVEGLANRNVGSAAGLETMQRLRRKLNTIAFDASDDASARLAKVETALRPSEWRLLKKSDLNINAIKTRIASTGGTLNWNEVRRGTWGLVDRTQFLQRPTAVPFLTRSSSMARVLTQMKSFSMRASGMIMEEVVKEAKAGNYAPLTRLAVTYPIVGEASRQVNSVIRHPITGKEEFPTDAQGIIKRALEDSIYVGGLGIFSDAVSAASRGKESWTGLFAGPGITDIGSELKSLFDMSQHRFGGPAEKQKYDESQRKWLMGWAKRVPFAGSAIADTMKTPQEIAKTIKAR